MNRVLYKKFTELLKNFLLSVSERSPNIPLMVPGTRRILLYHRFNQSYDPKGLRIDADTFEWQLQVLKKGWRVISLGDLLEALRDERILPSKTVVITVDDGYLDFYEVAYPLLLKYDLPATFFPTVHFVEGHIWLWPDILSYVLDSCGKSNLKLVFDGVAFNLHIRDRVARQQTWQRLSDFCSELPDQGKWEFIRYFSSIAGVSVPKKPVPDYAPVNYDQLEEMSRNGIEIGAHTLNHPILSQVDEATLKKELSEPKQILEARLGVKVKSLAYPSGREIDISPVVLDTARKCGYSGAVVTRREYGRYNARDRFQLPRMGVGNDRADFSWKIHGLELFAESAKSYLTN